MIEAVPIRSCERRGQAIDLVVDRSRNNRSQFVFTQPHATVAGSRRGGRRGPPAAPGPASASRSSGRGALRPSPIAVDSLEGYLCRFAGRPAEWEGTRCPPRTTPFETAIAFWGRWSASARELHQLANRRLTRFPHGGAGDGSASGGRCRGALLVSAEGRARQAELAAGAGRAAWRSLPLRTCPLRRLTEARRGVASQRP